MQVVPSEIESVTVYSSGAAITRVAELASGDGAWPAQVRVAGLPLALDDASVRIRVESPGDTGGLRAASFRVGLEVLDGAGAPEAYEEPLRVARQEVFVLEERLKDVERLTRRLAEISPPSRPAPAEGEAPPPSPHTGRMALLDFRLERLKSVHSAAEDLREKIRAAREVLASAEERKRRAGTAREARTNELRKTLVVALSAPAGKAASRARLLIDYHVPGARWAPAYAIHFDSDLSHATVSVRAMVGQKTGEDWRNVRIALSSAQMQAWTELPEMASLRLGRWQSPPRSGWRAAPGGAEELYTDYDRESAAIKSAAPSRPITDLERSLELADAGGARPAPVPKLHKPERSKFPKDLVSEEATGEFTRMFQAEQAPGAPPPRPPAPPAQAGPSEYTMMIGRRAAPAPMPPAMPPVQAPMLPSPRPATMAFRPPVPPSPLPPPPPLPPAVRPPSLEYGAMQMPGPGDPGRGKLTRIELASRLEVFALHVRVDTVAVVESARSDAARLSALPSMHAFPSTVEGFDYAYRAELPAEIPSDGQFHSIPLASQAAPSRLYYVTVPREAPDVFRFAEIDNPLDAPLMAGPADIYTGNVFLMTVPLRITPSKGSIKLGLGVEQRIRVARNTAFAESASGLMSGTLNLKHEIHIELRNQLRLPAQIEVRERVPVTRDGDEQLKVTASAKPVWEAYDPPGAALRGGYVWKVQAPPGEVVQLHASYSIGMPAKMEIAGGNRREM